MGSAWDLTPTEWDGVHMPLVSQGYESAETAIPVINKASSIDEAAHQLGNMTAWHGDLKCRSQCKQQTITV